MGIGFVIALWLVAGAAAASGTAVIFGILTSFFTRRAKTGRRAVIIASMLFPFACGVWAFGVFVAQAVVNEVFLYRDIGLGDTWHCPLPNGDQIEMIDVTDQGWVYNPKHGGPGEADDAIPGVRLLQVQGRYILGATDSNAFRNLGSDTSHVDSYFLLDTQSGKQTTYSNLGELQSATQPLGINVTLVPIYTLYSKYRYTWFDVVALLALLTGPAIAGTLIVRRILRVRKPRELVPAAA